MTELTKTLKLKLVDSNTHKRGKFRKTRDIPADVPRGLRRYCTALGEANDAVGDYQLSSYAKEP
ncbi:hypothetical protein [Haloarchaeobius iranensis]|uniref:hypothetical protein n=1 Tax=Haloarchaeobius iranensis TaxID=996166 RepID=UPI001113B220|nr:hypothetical protein [Haloarchaeobius iranensis]